MNKNCILKFAAPATLSLLAFCVSSYRTLSQTSDTEAGTLKTYCEQNNIQGPEITKADSLYSLAATLIQNGRNDEGYSKTDLAVFYYRVALCKKELKTGQQRYDGIQQRLNDDRNHLATYQQVLKEMKEKEAHQ